MTTPAATSATSAAVSHFAEIKNMLRIGQAAARPPAFMSGLGWGLLAIDTLAMANFADPFHFDEKGDAWTADVAQPIGSTWNDLLTSYNAEIPDYWTGDAQKALDAYLNKTIKPGSDALVALCNQMGVSMKALSSAVWTTDFELIGLVVTSAVVLNTLAGIDVATAGLAQPALIAGVLAYITALILWLKGVAAMFEIFSQQLTAVQQKANDVRNTIWQDGDPSGKTHLDINPNLTDPSHANNDYWTHNPKLDPKP